MDKKQEKQRRLAIMTQECNLLDQEIKKEQLLESVARVDEEIQKTKDRIAKLKGEKLEGEVHE